MRLRAAQAVADATSQSPAKYEIAYRFVCVAGQSATLSPHYAPQARLHTQTTVASEQTASLKSLSCPIIPLIPPKLQPPTQPPSPIYTLVGQSATPFYNLTRPTFRFDRVASHALVVAFGGTTGSARRTWILITLVVSLRSRTRVFYCGRGNLFNPFYLQ